MTKIRKPLFKKIEGELRWSVNTRGYRARYCSSDGTPLIIEMQGSLSGEVRVDVYDAKGNPHFGHWTLFPIMYPTFRSAIRAVVTITHNAGIMRADCPTALMMIPKTIRMKYVRAMAAIDAAREGEEK